MNLQLQEGEKTTTFGTTQDSYTSTRIPGNNEAPRVRGEEDEEESASSFLLLFPAFGTNVLVVPVTPFEGMQCCDFN